MTFRPGWCPYLQCARTRRCEDAVVTKTALARARAGDGEGCPGLCAIRTAQAQQEYAGVPEGLRRRR
jgi:hypothetical protein